MIQRQLLNFCSTGARRDFIKKPLALAAGSIVLSSRLGSLAIKANADGSGNDVSIAPRYYPLNSSMAGVPDHGRNLCFEPMYRGEALPALGADVIDTSRNLAGVPDHGRNLCFEPMYQFRKAASGD